MVQSDDGNVELHWIKFYPDRLLGSMNFKRCDIREQSLYLAIFVRVRRDGNFCGKLCYPDGEPITFKELIDDMNPSERDRIDLWRKAMNGLVKKTLIYIEDRQTDNLPLTHHCHPSGKLSGITTGKPLDNHCKNEHDNTQGVMASEGTDKSKNKNKEEDIYTPIFKYWNLAGLLSHKKLTDKMKRSINGRITEGYTVVDIVTAITTYSMVVNDKTGLYWWSHKNWSLDLFLQRGFERFRNREFALESFLKNKEDKEKLHRAKAAKEAEKTILTKPCPYCKGAGLDINAKPTAKEITPDAAKKIPATMMDRLVKDDGKYYTLGLPVCPQCKGAKRVPKENKNELIKA